MIGAGCGIGEHNLSQHSVKWCEKSGLEARQKSHWHTRPAKNQLT